MTDNTHHPLTREAAALIGAPLLMTRDRAAALVARLFNAPPSAMNNETRGAASKTYNVIDGVAQIRVAGELFNRESATSRWLGAQTYEGLAATLRAAERDPSVRGILLDIDSPGGEAAGAMEAAEVVRAAAAIKPVIALVDGMGASAAYALASGATTIVTTPSAMIGSIGVVMTHWDMSGLLDSWGLKATSIYAGEFKTDGSPYRPLADGEKARLRGTVNSIYQLFAATVGKHRPALGEAGARRTEAAVYVGAEAVAAGLADRVGTRADAMALACGDSRSAALSTTASPAAASGQAVGEHERGRAAFAAATGRAMSENPLAVSAAMDAELLRAPPPGAARAGIDENAVEAGRQVFAAARFGTTPGDRNAAEAAAAQFRAAKASGAPAVHFDQAAFERGSRAFGALFENPGARASKVVGRRR